MRAVHDGVAAIQLERIFEIVEAIAGHFVAAIDNPAVGLQQNGGAEIAVGVPPIAWAAGLAAEAQNTFIQAVELLAVFGRLQPLAIGGRGALRLHPRLDGFVLRIDMLEVGHEVFDNGHVR